MANSIDLKSFRDYADKLKQGSEMLHVLADAEASASSQIIARDARQRAPVNDGALRASIQPSGSDGSYAVNASANYAAYVEFGTRARVSVPADLQDYAHQFMGKGEGGNAKEMIYRWCKSKGIPQEAWYHIFLAIMFKGIKPQPFLFPAVDEETPKFYERLKKMLENLV